jgi:uncharacterized lipoprotein NlpE involved in copper resistance
MKKTICLLLVVAVIAGCNNRKNEIPAIDPAFTNYISGFTSGVISAGSNLTIRLLSDVPQSVREEVLDQILFECKPAIKGTNG